MATIVTRAGKGSPLTNAEVDANFTNLNTDKVEKSGDTMTGNLNFGDDVRIQLGDNNDLRLFHNGTRSFVQESGAGSLVLDTNGDDVRITHSTNAETMAVFTKNGSVLLKYDGADKLETTSSGVDVIGAITTTGQINMPNGHFVNRQFQMDAVDGLQTCYILLCRNAAYNDVNGTITMDRTSGLEHACQVDIIVSSGSSASPIGSLRAHGVTGNGEPTYTLVTVRYNTDNNFYVALKIFNPDAYHESSGAYFTGRLINSGQNSLLAVGTNDVSSESSLSVSNSRHSIDGDIDLGGNIILSGTVDGRDISADGTKLDGIEAGADVTDFTNVEAAGALMDSEVTNLAQVKAFSSSDYATAAQGTKADTAHGWGNHASAGYQDGTFVDGIAYENSATLSRSVGDGQQWVKICDLGTGQPNRIYLKVTHTGDNTNCEFEAEVSISGYGLLDHILVKNHQKYNNPKVTAIRTHQASSGDVEVWVQVENLTTSNGNLAVRSNKAIPTLTATSTEPTWANSKVVYTNTASTNYEIIPSSGILFQDNAKASFGTSEDLQIYHDGSNSYVSDQGIGNLKVLASTVQIMNALGDENGLVVRQNAEVELYHNGLEKLATTSTGIDVTGTVTADGLTVENSADTTINFGNASDADDGTTINVRKGAFTSSKIQFLRTNDQYNDFEIKVSNDEDVLLTYGQGNISNDLFFRRSSDLTPVLGLKNSGDISFYSDDGLSQDLYWDASTSRLGLGTTSPSFKLDVQSGTDDFGARFQSSDSTSYVSFQDNSTTNSISVFCGASGDHFIANGKQKIRFLIDVSEAMLIDSNGNVGIGTTSPDTPLHVNGTTLKVSGSSTGFTEGALLLQNDGIAGFRGNGTYMYDSGTDKEWYTGTPYSSNDQYIIARQTSVADGSQGKSTAQTTHALLTVNSSGNVGIGTTNPLTTLHVKHNGGGFKLQGANSDQYGAYLDFAKEAGTRRGLLGYTGSGTSLTIQNDESGDIRFNNNGSEAARIDSSGNLLVGKTQSGTNNTVAGLELQNDGQVFATKSGAPELFLTRLGSDGEIANFYKDSTQVGSIGTTSDDLCIHSTATDHRGLRFGQGFVSPITATATTSDGGCDLGESSARFKDFYLSGDVISDGSVFSNVSINAQTGTTYTTVLTDRSKLVTLDNASAVTVTIPPNSSVAYPTGTKIDLLAKGAGQVTVAAGSGVTVNSSQTLNLRAQWSAASVVKLATDTWVLLGDLEAS